MVVEADLLGGIAQLREEKARLEQKALAMQKAAIEDAEAAKKAAALETEAHTQAALASEVAALQQKKCRLEEDIRVARASQANEVEEPGKGTKMAEDTGVQAEELSRAEDVE